MFSRDCWKVTPISPQSSLWTFLFADHELKIPSERKLLRKNSSCHNEFPSIISLAFLYSCHCCTIMVMKHLPAQTSSLSYLRSGAPLRLKGSLKQRKIIYSVKIQTVPCLAFLPGSEWFLISASQIMSMFEHMKHLKILLICRFWFIRSGVGLRCCISSKFPRMLLVHTQITLVSSEDGDN